MIPKWSTFFPAGTIISAVPLIGYGLCNYKHKIYDAAYKDNISMKITSCPPYTNNSSNASVPGNLTFFLALEEDEPPREMFTVGPLPKRN